MIACSVSIRLDKKEYLPGELVTGEVTLRGDENWKCHGLDVWLGLENPYYASIRFGEVSLFVGAIEKDVPIVRRFELKAPDRPLTHLGENVEICLMVFARAKLPMAFDPDDKVLLSLVGGPGAFPEIASSETETALVAVSKETSAMVPALSRTRGRRKKPKWVPLGTGVVSSGMAALVLGFEVGVDLAPIIAMSFGSIGAISLLVGLFPLAVGGRTGAVAVSWRQEREDPHALLVRVELAPGSSVDKVSARVRVDEKRVVGTGNDRQEMVKTVQEREAVLAPVSRAGSVFEGRVEVPDAPYFGWLNRDRSYGIAWALDVDIDIPRWPDWHETFDLDVKPSSTVG